MIQIDTDKLYLGSVHIFISLILTYIVEISN